MNKKLILSLIYKELKRLKDKEFNYPDLIKIQELEELKKEII